MEINNPDLEMFRQQWQKELANSDPRLQGAREVSVATTMTMRAISREPSEMASSQEFSPTPGPAYSSLFVDDDVDMESTEPDSSAANKTVFTIATDFGTTFSSVVFTKRVQGQQGPLMAIDHYPDDTMPYGYFSREVPTEMWYHDKAIARKKLADGSANVGDEPFENIFADDEPLPNSDNNEDTSEYRRGGSVKAREPMEMDEDNDDDGPAYWGYQIQNQLLLPATDHSKFNRITRFKLLLDTSEKTEEIRDEIKPIVQRLKRLKMIRKDSDLISDYLRVLFIHAKAYLMEKHGLDSSCTIEHVLCVPIVWTSKACRTMQACMETAIRATDFGSLDNLFIVSEPEAAAASVLQDSDNINVRCH